MQPRSKRALMRSQPSRARASDSASPCSRPAARSRQAAAQSFSAAAVAAARIHASGQLGEPWARKSRQPRRPDDEPLFVELDLELEGEAAHRGSAAAADDGE